MKITFLVLSVLVIIALTVLAYYGLFASVSIKEQEIGPYYLVYEKHIGPYKNTYKTMDSVYYRLFEEDKVETTRGFGIYYDKPGSVPDEQLRSIVGCILDGEGLNKIEELSKKYKIVEFPRSSGLVVVFPYKGVISVFLGIFRVYPKLEKFMAKGNYPHVPVMEIYDVPEKTIQYNVPVQMPSDVLEKYLQ